MRLMISTASMGPWRLLTLEEGTVAGKQLPPSSYRNSPKAVANPTQRSSKRAPRIPDIRQVHTESLKHWIKLSHWLVRGCSTPDSWGFRPSRCIFDSQVRCLPCSTKRSLRSSGYPREDMLSASSRMDEQSWRTASSPFIKGMFLQPT